MWRNTRLAIATRVSFLLVLCAFGVASPIAQAAETKPATYHLRGNLTADLIATSAFTTAWFLADTALKEPLAPNTCRWCDANGFDTAIRNGLKWQDPGAAALISDVGIIAAGVNAFGTLALLAKFNAQPKDLALNSLYVLEAVSITMTFTNAVKVIVGRQRPAVHFSNNDVGYISPAEGNLSFFSGHSAVTFSLASAAGSVASLRGYRHAPWIWSAGLAIAAVTAYARIGADAHYASDVLVGAAVGSAMGAFIPRWLHPRAVQDSADRKAVAWRPLIAPVPYGGAMIGMQGAL